MILGILATVAICATLFSLSQLWWRSLINPVSLGILVWTPALIMLNFRLHFLSPYYIQFNRPVSVYVYIALIIGFASFWLGCALVKALSPRDSFVPPPPSSKIDFSRTAAVILFAIGFAIFVYGYFNSGLADIGNLKGTEIRESQSRLSFGPVSLLTLLMNVAAVAMFVVFIRFRRLKYLIIPVIAVACYAATLQKSLVIGSVVAFAAVGLIYYKDSLSMLFGSKARSAVTAGIMVSFIALMFFLNSVRGINEVRLTSAQSTIMEQVFIYSGASAIMNLSVTIDEYLPSDPPMNGAYLARPILRYFIDREYLNPTRYFGGVNTGTYLLYGWADFRWLGLFIMPILTGAFVMTFIRMAFTGKILGLILGGIALRAVVLSTASDVIFDPLTWITIVISILGCTVMRLPVPRNGVSIQDRESERAPAPRNVLRPR